MSDYNKFNKGNNRKEVVAEKCQLCVPGNLGKTQMCDTKILQRMAIFVPWMKLRNQTNFVEDSSISQEQTEIIKSASRQ